MSKAKDIIKARIEEAETDNVHHVNIWEPDGKEPFQVAFQRVAQKIDRKPPTARLKLYKALMASMIQPLTASPANKQKLQKASKEFLKNFDKIMKEHE